LRKKIACENLKGGYNLRELDVDLGITLQWIFKKTRFVSYLSGAGYILVPRLYEYCIVTSDSIKGKK